MSSIVHNVSKKQKTFKSHSPISELGIWRADFISSLTKWPSSETNRCAKSMHAHGKDQCKTNLETVTVFKKIAFFEEWENGKVEQREGMTEERERV